MTTDFGQAEPIGFCGTECLFRLESAVPIRTHDGTKITIDLENYHQSPLAGEEELGIGLLLAQQVRVPWTKCRSERCSAYP